MQGLIIKYFDCLIMAYSYLDTPTLDNKIM